MFMKSVLFDYPQKVLVILKEPYQTKVVDPDKTRFVCSITFSVRNKVLEKNEEKPRKIVRIFF